MVDPDLINASITALGAVTTLGIGTFAYSRFDFNKSGHVKIRTNQRKFEPTVTPKKKHALIVLADGGKSLRERINNTSDYVYKTLKENGYQDENIHVLDGKRNPPTRFNCNSLPSSKKYLNEVFNHLYQTVDPNDSFFMYVLTHGSKAGLILPIGQSIINLDKGNVSERELEELMSDLKPDYSLTYFNSCFSGGFAKRLGKGKNIAISTSKSNKVTGGYGGPLIEHKYGKYASNFTLNFFSAIRGQYPNGEKINISNKSINEIFNFSYKNAQIQNKDVGNFAISSPHLVYGNIDPKKIIF